MTSAICLNLIMSTDMLHLPAWIVRTVPREVNLIVTWHYQNVFTAYPVIHRYLGAFVLNIKKIHRNNLHPALVSFFQNIDSRDRSK